ncbi:MAG: aldehyde dehydrogenase [Rhodospirillaceae bacterium]|nr:aldehyde dehydrogenase [Rhodospirillaceae bacterium]
MIPPFDPFQPAQFLDGAYRSTRFPYATERLNPATLKPVGHIASCTDEDVAFAAAVARRAQRPWAATDARSRAAVLHRIANTIERMNPHAVARMMVEEMGKPYPEAVGELANCASVFRYYAELARDDVGKVAGTTQAGSLQYARAFPYGVSVHILPFNYPILLMCWTVAASLAAGNACIVKPAGPTTLCTLRFMQAFSELPAGLIAVLPGEADTAQALIRSPGTHVVAFTGSVPGGRAVASACGALLKPCIVEAGGSDAMIVTDHAPLEVAVPGCVTAAFHLSGQICTSAERFFVTDAIHDTFVDRFAAATKALRIGNGLDRAEIGPLVSEASRDRVARLVEETVAAGATLVCGGRVPPSQATGWFYEPTILTDVPAGAAILREEVFGPVAAITRVPDFSAALARANDTEFGLGASIFTTDLAEAHRATEVLETGMVWVNNPLIDNDALPFGGWKLSGMGRELGRQGLDAFRQTKMVVIDHKPKVQSWWYPYPDQAFYRSDPDEL